MKIRKKRIPNPPSVEKDGQYGDILVLELDESRPAGNGKHYVFKCRCKCGFELSMTTQEIKYNRKCHHNDYRKLTGFTIGNIRVLEEDGFDTRYNRKRRKWKYECLLCGKIKSEVADVIIRGDIQSCGDHKPSGENHHNYNPNQDKYRRDSRDCKAWSKSIMIASDYKCIVCGDNKRLNAHHLDGFKWCVERRFDLTNGACMCIKCHKDFHSKYGSGKNTESQFIEYIDNKLKIVNDFILDYLFIDMLVSQ